MSDQPVICDECGTPLEYCGPMGLYCPSDKPHPKHDARVKKMIADNDPVARLAAALSAKDAEIEALRSVADGFAGFWRSGNGVPVERAVIRADHPAVLALYRIIAAEPPK